MSKLDEEALKEALAAHKKLIARALDSEDRHRFMSVQRIASLSQQLLAIDRPRAGDFDDGTEIINEGQIIGAPQFRRLHPGEDNAELLRTVIDAIGPFLEHQKAKTQSESRKAQVEELASMISLRKTMKDTGEEDTSDIDARIDFLKSEIQKKEDSHALVPAELLRRYSPGEEGQRDHVHNMGSTDRD